MLNRRRFLAAVGSSLLASGIRAKAATSQIKATIRAAAQSRGIDVGAMLRRQWLNQPAKLNAIKSDFSLIANEFDEIEWGSNPGFHGDPEFRGLTAFLQFAKENDLRPRIRQIYSHENLPRNAHLRDDGTPKNKSELEKTLLTRVEQVCRPLNGHRATIQVIDEILADHEGGIRSDPFADAFGDNLGDILFHAAHEFAPDALLTYQEFGPEVDPNRFFKRKTRDVLALLDRWKNRGVPVTGFAVGGWITPTHGGPDLDVSVFKAIENLGLDIHVNELNIDYQDTFMPKNFYWHPKNQETNDRIVEEQYVTVCNFFCKFKKLKEITFWASIDHDNADEFGSLSLLPYANARPGLFNADLTPKHVYGAVADAVAKSKPIF